MARVVDIIEKNIAVIKLLMKLGKVPISVMNDYDIYNMWLSYSHEKSQMKRYKIVANIFKVSDRTVIRAVNEMKKFVN